MRGARFVSLLCFILFTPQSFVLGQDRTTSDSVFVLKQDSLAYKFFLSKPDSSIAIVNRTLNTALRLQSPYLEGYGYFILSKAYWAKANYRLSTEFGFKALRIFENTGEINLWGESLLSLGRTCTDLRDFENAGKFIRQAIDLGRRSENESLLAAAFRENSMLLSELKQYDSALYYADRGIALYEKSKDSLNASILYGRKAKVYFFKKDFKQSAYYNKMSLLFDSLVNNRRALAIAYYQSALDAIHADQLDEGIRLLKKSIPINHEINNLGSLVKVHELLANIYLSQHKTDLAAEQLKIVSQYKDSLYNVEKSGQIQEMQILYELTNKEKTIRMLEQENILKLQQVKSQRLALALLVACILLLVTMVFFLTRLRKIQAKTNDDLAFKNAAIEQQKEEILSQAESLQQLNQLKLKLFSVISHDVRGPIGTLHGLLDLLTRKGVSQQEFVAISEKLKAHVGLTKRTLENLLNWSLSQMEGIKTQIKILSIKSAIDDVKHLMQEAAQQKNITIENQSEESVNVKADPNQLELILRNLIHNAIKFSKPNSKIEISATPEEKRCIIKVTDYGIGMTSEELQTLLISKIHFSKAGTGQEKGTGLGLLLCREFIKHNGGDFDIISKTNQGTTVTFTLPLANVAVLH